MKNHLTLAATLCGAALLSGCAFDDGFGRVGRVSVSTRSTPAYYGSYSESTPYYSHSDRRYYRSGNRYVYYSSRRPYYVNSLPTRSVYITPSHRTHQGAIRYRD